MATGRFVNVEDFEKNAKKILPPAVWDYYRGGAGHEVALQNNRAIFKQFRLRPNMFVDVAKRDLSVSVLGTKLSIPIGISPTGFQKLAHPDGESAAARAAGHMGTVFIQSVWSNTKIEDVAAAAPNAIKWMQMHPFKPEVVQRLVAEAEKADYKAIVLSADTPVFVSHYVDIHNNFTLPTHLKLPNLEEVNSASYIALKSAGYSLTVESHTWGYVKWLKSITKLPLVLKGILTAEDALTAAELGVAALIVSNHGARQLDHVISPLEALPEIVKAVAGRCEVYMDSGIRVGNDVFTALALGAKMVFVGRPVLWGLAADGEQGVIKVLDILKTELDETLALTGHTQVTKFNPRVLVKVENSRL